ncbi:MAG: IS4 family transposase [Bacillota bacterium]|nr:IS4 family transposase [Bacillota bacterium]
MKKGFYRRIIDVSSILEERYIDVIREDKNDFIRHRKVTVQDLFLQMFANKGESQKNEIHNFYEDQKKTMDISQTAFFNARMKFNPEALLIIMQDLMKETYAEPEDLVTLNGYYIMAIDGSDFVFPDVEKIKTDYGEAEKDKYGNSQAMASISTIFDCINKVFLDVSINPYKFSERKSAEAHLNKITEILPENAKYLCIFDRGYASIKLIDQMLERKQKFLFRLQPIHFKKEQSVLTKDAPDQWIDVIYDRQRTNEYRNDKKFRVKLMNTIHHLRFVRINTTKGTQTFITNLSEEEFDTSGIGELYHIRWDVETSYRSLKSQMCAEDFSGYRDILVRQDIYASAFVYNAVSMTIAEQKEVQMKPEDRYKYVMKTNRNYAIGIMKQDFLKMFVLYRDKKAVKEAQERFEKDIIKYSCPVRKGRSPERYVKGTSKCKLSYRRSY